MCWVLSYVTSSLHLPVGSTALLITWAGNNIQKGSSSIFTPFLNPESESLIINIIPYCLTAKFCSFLKLHECTFLPIVLSHPAPHYCMVNLYKPAIPNNAILPFLAAPWLFTGCNVWWSQHVLIFTFKKKKKRISRGKSIWQKVKTFTSTQGGIKIRISKIR